MDIHSLLRKYFGYESFRPGQEEIINSILSGKNALAILPTGGGKSICYQIPALMSERFSIVISPLIALMKDQVDSLNRSGIPASFINSSLDYASTEKVLMDIANNRIKLLYVSPEKLENNYFIERIKNYTPEYIFIDEAHCISEWGHNFRPSYRKILNFLKHTGVEKVSAFTATATEEVRNDIIKQLELKNAEIFVKGFERNNISLNVIRTTRKKEKALEIVKMKGLPAIIYASTREGCEEISYYLNSHGFNTAYYHAGLTTELRKIIQDDFLENRVDIICATNAFGMGIDKQNIRLIIHLNMPGSIENYYQEFGRAGRDGLDSDVYLLYDRRDESIQRYFIDNSFPTEDAVKIAYDALCDSIKLAVGNEFTPGINLDQNFFALLLKNGITKGQIDNILAVLESSGYLQKNSDFDKGHFVRVLLPREKLESYMKSFADNRYRDMLVVLLRTHGAPLLTERHRINTLKIAEELDSDKNSVSELLEELGNMGILHYEKPSNYPVVKLKGPRVKSENLLLDTEKFKALTENQNRKLNSIIDFVNAEECRFRTILKYFGEDAGSYKCGRCDICRNDDIPDRINLEFFQEKILETIHENEGKIRMKVLTDILKGKEDKRKYSVYSNFGCAKHFGKDIIENAVSFLISQDAVTEINGMLALTEKGKSHFTSGTPAAGKKEDDYEKKLKLFNLLSNARKEAASKFSQPLQLICSDEILKKIADARPLTPAALLSIEGFNQRMFNKIGDEFLSIINDFSAAPAEENRGNSENLLDLKSLITKKYKLEEIASLTRLSEAVISIQIESMIKYDRSLNYHTLLPQSEYKLICDKIVEGYTTLKELKENLPSNISYGKIRIALAIKSI